jgi:hypothetical protein
MSVAQGDSRPAGRSVVSIAARLDSFSLSTSDREPAQAARFPLCPTDEASLTSPPVAAGDGISFPQPMLSPAVPRHPNRNTLPSSVTRVDREGHKRVRTLSRKAREMLMYDEEPNRRMRPIAPL